MSSPHKKDQNKESPCLEGAKRQEQNLSLSLVSQATVTGIKIGLHMVTGTGAIIENTRPFSKHRGK